MITGNVTEGSGCWAEALMSMWRGQWWLGWAPGWEVMGSCSLINVEDAGLGWRTELVREGVGEVCVEGCGG